MNNLVELNFEPVEPKIGMKFSKHKNKIVDMIKKNNGYCVCSIYQEPINKCPCYDYNEKSECHCNLYVKD